MPDGKSEFSDYGYEDDAAVANSVEGWRTPTHTEMKELYDYCSWEWTEDYNGTGVCGYIATSKKPGYTDRSIFLPAAGCKGDLQFVPTDLFGGYWSSSLATGIPNCSCGLYFNKTYVDWNGWYRRGVGFQVRPVTQ